MAERNFFDTFANTPYSVIMKDKDGNYSSCGNFGDKEVAIEVANICLKTYKYVKIIHEPTNQVV